MDEEKIVAEANKPIGENQIAEAMKIFEKYKEGKSHLEEKIKNNEQWWKLRHWQEVKKGKEHKSATAWLWNTIVSKHADMEDGFPEPNILPREQNDIEEAKILSSIIPVILDNNKFHKTYSDVCWYKLKQGCGIYCVSWDGQKLNGLGDIAINKIDGLNLFWEPGISDIQDSENVFLVSLWNNSLLKSSYPQITDSVLGNTGLTASYIYDDAVDTTEKTPVIDWYYKRTDESGKIILHYCKFVGKFVIYATENETEAITDETINPETGEIITTVIKEAPSKVGLYNHGLYPFVFDSLYDIEGTPFGYGYTDIFKDTQGDIDQMNAAMVKNTMMSAKKRFFSSSNSGVNPNDFADWNKEIIDVAGAVDEQHIREITVNPLPGSCLEMLNSQINALKETSGNRDVNNGGTQSGITAASAIAAMQEAGNKNSRDTISGTYECMKDITYLVIELIRQFYDTPRTFRIIGKNGGVSFQSYDNSGLQPEFQGEDFGNDMGYRIPQFDIKVGASKASPYNRMAQNELALQFYQLGFFNPRNATVAESVLDMMDFDGKDNVIEKIRKNGTILSLFSQLFNICIGLAQRFDPNVIAPIMQMGIQAGVVDPNDFNGMPETISRNIPRTDSSGNIRSEEPSRLQKVREEVQSSAQPNG